MENRGELIFTTKHLYKEYRYTAALQDVNITIPRGQIYGLIGENGAGKTTLLRILCGLTRPSRGRMFLFGAENAADQIKMRRRMGCLVDGPALYADLTAWQNLKVQCLQRGLDEAAISPTLQMGGLKDTGGKTAGKFSLGMRQRLGIAQAIRNDPKLLVLDEPTAGLDPGERIRFRNLISRLAKGRIILLATHIVSDVEYIAKEILLLRRGTLVMQGTPRELEQSIQGKVWEVSVNEAEMALMVDTYCVSNIKQQDGSYLLRIVDDGKPLRGAKPVSPNLDDVFLHTFFQPSEGQI